MNFRQRIALTLVTAASALAAVAAPAFAQTVGPLSLQGAIDLASENNPEYQSQRNQLRSAAWGVRSAYGVTQRPIGSGVLLAAPGLDGSLVFNRLLGYGVDGSARSDEVDAAIAAFEAAGTRVWTVQVAPVATALAGLVRSRGLEAHPRDWIRFARAPAPPEEASPELSVRAAGRGDAEAFGAVFCGSFGVPAGVAPWVGALVGRSRWRCFLAWDGAEPVGIGAIYLGDGLGWLGFGGTLPSHRGRGGQTAMFAARFAAGSCARKMASPFPPSSRFNASALASARFSSAR